MPDLDTLQRIWPLISAHPWEFGWVSISAFLIGVGAHKAWNALTSARPSAPKAVPAAKRNGPSLLSKQFVPNRLQIECIIALRHFDDAWITATTMLPMLPAGTARADVRQALEELTEKGWAGDRLYAGKEAEYRLKGPGLDYARSKGFPAATKSSRQVR